MAFFFFGGGTGRNNEFAIFFFGIITSLLIRFIRADETDVAPCY